MRFANWPFLFLLFLLPLLHRWWTKRNQVARIQFPLPIPVKASQKNPARVLMALKYGALVFLTLALARPQLGFQQNERVVSGVDIELILDISPSMNIEDLAERPRIEVAKDTIENFVKGRHNDRIGLVVFSGEPLTMAPLTLDYGLLLRGLRQSNTGTLRDGTAIGDGLTLGVSHLKESKAKSKVVILLTDGDNNIGRVDPATAGEIAAGYGIRVYTIAIGREGRVKMPIRHQGPFGNVITTYQWMENVLNPELLQLIAKTTQGKFYRVTDEKALGSVFQEIDQLEKSEVKSIVKTKYDDVFEKPLKLCILLLLIGFLLEKGWWRFYP